jgi:excisionase family DNA binding protein
VGQTQRERVTLQEAARLLGVSEGAVRKRVKRGTIGHEKDADGRLYVYLDAILDEGLDGGVDGVSTLDNDALISALRSRIELLEEEISDWKSVLAARDRELESRSQELSRKDHLLAQMNQNIAALTRHVDTLAERLPAALEPPPDTPSEPRDGREATSERDAKGDVPPEQEERSWWRRLFGA